MYSRKFRYNEIPRVQKYCLVLTRNYTVCISVCFTYQKIRVFTRYSACIGTPDIRCIPKRHRIFRSAASAAFRTADSLALPLLPEPSPASPLPDVQISAGSCGSHSARDARPPVKSHNTPPDPSAYNATAAAALFLLTAAYQSPDC